MRGKGLPFSTGYAMHQPSPVHLNDTTPPDDVQHVREVFLRDFAREYQAFRRLDPEGWAAEIEETRAWATTLMDGLEDEPWE
jgi:hypothetical protein